MLAAPTIIGDTPYFSKKNADTLFVEIGPDTI